MTDPTTRLLESAQADVITAEEALAAAAEQGTDTEGPRAALVAAEARLKAVEAARHVDKAQAAADRQAAMREEAAGLLAEAQAEISAAIAEYATLIVPQTPTLYSETATNLLAEQEVNRVRAAACAAYDERLAALRAEQAALAARRQAILERRAEGDEQDNDAAEVRLLELDAEVLADLLAKLETAPPPRQADTTWATRWQKEVADAKRQAYGNMAAALGDRMADLIGLARKDFGRATVTISTRLQAALAGVGVRV